MSQQYRSTFTLNSCELAICQLPSPFIKLFFLLPPFILVPISHFHSQSPLYFLSLHAFTTTKINLNSINFSTIKKKLNIFIFSFLWFCSFHSKHTQKETNPPPCISPSFNLHTHTHPDKLLLINCQFSIASQTCQVVLGQQAVTLASQKNKNLVSKNNKTNNNHYSRISTSPPHHHNNTKWVLFSLSTSSIPWLW